GAVCPRRCAVGDRLELTPEPGCLRAPCVDQEPSAVLGKRGELPTHDPELAVIAADVVDEADRRPVAHKGSVRLAGLRDDRADGRAGHEAAGTSLADERRAAE